MKMDVVASSQNDEFYTPEYAVSPILKYVNGFNKIWCPFDTEQSNFVKMLVGVGKRVEHSHLSDGKDFFKYQPDDYDCIVSNPPYSMKGKVFERLFELKKPFAMLVGVVGLFESNHRFTLFEENSFEVMYLNKRVSYFKSYDDPKPSLNPPFSSVYVCSGVLPKQVVFERIRKVN